MVVVKLKGGMGNQLFQYACGRALATRLRTNLVLDLEDLLDRSPRKDFIFRDFDLDLFLLKPYTIFNEKIKRKFNRRFIFKPSKIEIKEVGFYYSSCVNEVNKGNIYLDGYWQSYKYFETIASELRKELQFSIPLTDEQILLRKKIKQSTSVCMNFRRADFVTIPSAIQTHGVPNMSFYYDALKIIKEKIGGEISVFVFSDDIEWSQVNFKIDDMTYFVTHKEYKGERFSAYLQLMSQCKHFIIPNSTFGWWAAWLADYKEKIVITPKQWFVDPLLQSQTQDLRPENWITI